MTGFKTADNQGKDNDNKHHSETPPNDNRDKTRLQRFFSRNTLSSAFNMAATAGTGAVVGFAVKTTALTFFGSQFLAIAAGAAAISASTTAVKRTLDIRAYNKTHTDNKLSYIKDFFKAEKTGHNAAHYKRAATMSAGFALLGGVGGYFLADFLNGGAPDATPETTPELPPTEASPVDPNAEQAVPDYDPTTPEPTIDEPQPPQTDSLVPEVPPTSDTPEVPDSLETLPNVEDPQPETPSVDTVDPAPVEQAPVDNAPVEEAPVDTPPVDAAPQATPVDVAPAITLADRLAATLDEARALLPEDTGRTLADALNRLDSASERVQAQALKDLGYFFANGKAGVLENDVMANKLYELALEVSNGQNVQALHDLGYQHLYGFGTEIDTARAHELLSQAAEGGHRLSQPMLDYMAQHNLAPN